ncbi:MAG: carotenoid biosynthesis protein [Bacteroidia bacterium]
MERPQRATIAGIVLLILHGVGVLGFSMEGWKPIFETLTPLNLLITNLLLGFFHKAWTRRFATWAVLCFLAGFLVEVAGEQTGLIIGEYAYSEVLGPRLLGTPLLIGLNWLMLVYVSGVLCEKISGKPLLVAALGASLMTAMDLIMEPVAIKLNFWTWFGQHPPVQNFIAWWLIAFVLVLGFALLSKRTVKNPLAGWVQAAQLLFFGGLFF